MTTRLFIFGTGVHARKVYHYAVDCEWHVAAFVDEDVGAVAPIDGVPVLLPHELAEPAKGDAMFVAIGRADVRRRLMDRVAAAGWSLPALVHRTAWVAPDATLEAGVLVAAAAVVETAATVERGAIIDIGVLVDHECRIGAFCHLRPGEVCGPRHEVSSPL